MTCTLLGLPTPSSSTVLEPVTTAVRAEVPEAGARFGRFAVTGIAMSPQALAPFAPAGILAAGRLPSRARCRPIPGAAPRPAGSGASRSATASRRWSGRRCAWPAPTPPASAPGGACPRS